MWLKEKEFSVRLGGNTFIDVPILIRYRDEPIFSLSRSDNDGLLGIDFEVYDQKRQKVATVRRNNIYFGDKPAFVIEGDADRLTLMEKTSSQVLVDIRMRAAATSELDVSVRTYLPDGNLLDLGPTSSNIMRNTFAGNVLRNSAVGIQIGPRTGMSKTPA